MNAQNLIGELVIENRKEELVKHVAELYEVERATMCLTGNRDHVIHALNTFLLGEYINKKFLLKDSKIDLFQWKLSALFHDIAYPLEISQQIIRRYLKKSNSIKRTKPTGSCNLDLKLLPKNFEKLTNNKFAFDLIKKRVVDDWGLEVDIKERYKKMIKDNKLCHGILSSLTVLYLIDSMYQKNNPERVSNHQTWSAPDFEKHIVSACSAIFLHNLYPNDFFMKIDKTMAPLPYLLKLCDELQNWDRPKKGMPDGDPSVNYDIKIEDDKLTFLVKYKKDRNDIEKKIKCLNDPDIIIKQFASVR